METESLNKIVAAPTIIELGGKEETLYPLRFIEWGILERWMRTQIILAAKDSIAGLIETEAMIIMKSAHQVATGISVLSAIQAGEGGALGYLKSFEGMLKILHLSLRTDGSRTAKLKYSYIELNEMIAGRLTFLSETFVKILDISFPEIFETELTKEDEKNSEAAK